jgi:hypothetical protein
MLDGNFSQSVNYEGLEVKTNIERNLKRRGCENFTASYKQTLFKEHFNAPYRAIVTTQPPSLYFSGMNIIKLSRFSTTCCRTFTYSWMLRHV